MIVFGIAFLSIYAFNKNAETKIFDPTVVTSFSLYAVNNASQTNELLAPEAQESVKGDQLYCQLNSKFEGTDQLFEGMVTLRCRMLLTEGSENSILKTLYVTADAGNTLYSDGFVIDIPRSAGEIILTLEGIGTVEGQQVEFLQTASVSAASNMLKINYLPRSSVLYKDFSFDSVIGKQSVKFISLIVFLAAVCNFIYSLLDENKRNLRLIHLDAVQIDKPVNLLKTKVIRLYSPNDLRNIALKRNKEILVYIFSSKLSYFYILINEITYLYVHNSKSYIKKASESHIKKRRHSDVSIS